MAHLKYKTEEFIKGCGTGFTTCVPKESESAALSIDWSITFPKYSMFQENGKNLNIQSTLGEKKIDPLYGY